MRRCALAVSICCACSLAGGGVAHADLFGAIGLASVRPVQTGSTAITEQADSASEPAISGDGRYVAFVGSFGGMQGIWRRDLESDVVEQVAPGAARRPSISADGRYVSFTTAARLAPEDDDNGAPDVYRRDMGRACQTSGGACLACAEQQDAAELEACPFVLVSAVDGGSVGATYSYAHPETEEGRFGSLASARSAMSSDGHLVVFETGAESNLLGGATPSEEILVRNLETHQTSLVSSEYDPQTAIDTGTAVPVSRVGNESVGAAYPAPAFGGAGFGGASISADGSTVAWLGQSIALQARMLPGEYVSYDALSNEPLWRRIVDGPSTPTRRVTGGSDPENPICAASAESQLPGNPSLLDPCQGPFALFNHLAGDYLLAPSGVNFVPQLSANGDEVAFLASGREVASGQEFAETDLDDDLYVSNMREGLSRVEATQRLTAIGAEISDVERAAKIVDVTVSPDGSEVAFTTVRTQFPLGTPSYVSPTAPRAGIAEVYDADLADGTLTRVTHGTAGEATPSEQAGNPGEAGGAAAPSFADNGNTLSFSSSAYNLVYGDGNGASDVFVVDRLVFAGGVPAQFVSNPPGPPALAPARRLSATAVVHSDGTVVLSVVIPEAGQLAAAARGSVPVMVRAARAVRASSASRRQGRVLRVLRVRTVAGARARFSTLTDPVQKLTLVLAPPYRALAARSSGLYTAIALSFTAAGHPTLRTNLHVTFRRRAGAHAKQRASGSAATSGQRR